MEPTKPVKTPVNPLAKATSSAKRATTLAVFATILTVIAIVFIALLWQQTLGLHSGIKGKVSNLQRQTSQNNNQFSTSLNKIKVRISEQSEQINSILSNLNQVLSISSHRSEQIALSEADYLIHLANLHLQVGHNAKIAAKLLKLALNEIKPLDNTLLLPLKRALNTDINKLDAVKSVDVASLILRLDNLNNKIENVFTRPMIFQSQTTSSQQPQKNKKDEVKTEQLPWYKQALHGLAGLKELIIIRHHVYPTIPLLSPTQQFFLLQNIKLKLLQAEWAILNHQPKIYQQALQQVEQWLQSFSRDPAAIDEINQEIQSLTAIDIKPKLPNISASLIALQQATDAVFKSQQQIGPRKQSDKLSGKKLNSQQKIQPAKPNQLQPLQLKKQNPGVAI